MLQQHSTYCCSSLCKEMELAMGIRNDLQRVRKEFEAQDASYLASCLLESGVPSDEVYQMDRDELIDYLMALEEHAAFH